MPKYYLTGYNLQKLNGRVSDEYYQNNGDKRPINEIVLHISRDCSLLANEKSGIVSLEFEKQLPRQRLEPTIDKGKQLFCCRECHDGRYFLAEIAASKTVEEKAELLAKRKFGLI